MTNIKIDEVRAIDPSFIFLLIGTVAIILIFFQMITFMRNNRRKWWWKEVLFYSYSWCSACWQLADRRTLWRPIHWSAIIQGSIPINMHSWSFRKRKPTKATGMQNGKCRSCWRPDRTWSSSMAMTWRKSGKLPDSSGKNCNSSDEKGRAEMDGFRICLALPFLLYVIVTNGVKRRSAWQRSWQSYGDWGCPQQAGFAKLAGGLVWRNGASVYTDAQLADLLELNYLSIDIFRINE